MSDRAADAMREIANAITPLGASPAEDASGGYVASLTEAVMGVAAALNRIADAQEDIAYQMASSEVAACLNLIAVAIREHD